MFYLKIKNLKSPEILEILKTLKILKNIKILKNLKS